MRAGRSITVMIDPTNHVGWVAGWRGRWIVEQCGGRPMWSRRRNAWNTSERVAHDVIAFAEASGIYCTYTEAEVAS